VVMPHVTLVVRAFRKCHMHKQCIFLCSMQCVPHLANMVATAQPLTHATAVGQGSVDLSARTQVRTM
jgi:hypothetical protein